MAEKVSCAVQVLHSHFSPLLYDQSNPFGLLMVISSQSSVSAVAWELSSINVPLPQYLTLIVVPQYIECCLCNLHVSCTSSCMEMH